MKKTLCGAILMLFLGACYTPLNNSGVATTKPWLEVSGKKTDFDGKQYDSCYRFNVRFWPQEAAEQVDLKTSCISACCWRGDKNEVTLDFNKNFDENLAYYGRARKYTPSKITFKVSHSNLVNTTKVTVSPTGAVNNDGLIKLSYKEYDNPARLLQIEEDARRLQVGRNAYLIEQAQRQAQEEAQDGAKTARRASRAKAAKAAAAAAVSENLAKALVQRKAGAKIDAYFYQMDKSYKKQAAVFLLSDRILQTRALNDAEQIVSCFAKARTGADEKNLKPAHLACGVWRVNVKEETVTPEDRKARQILED